MTKEKLCKVNYGRRYTHLASFHPEEILSLVGKGKKEEFSIDGKIYNVKLESGRLHCFKRSLTCVRCGRIGNIISLDLNRDDKDGSPHFNLYCKETDSNGNTIYTLMTKDHIIPKSRGGKNHADNYQTMCEFCNQKKSNHTENELIEIKNKKLKIAEPHCLKSIKTDDSEDHGVRAICIEFLHPITNNRASNLLKKIKDLIE